jgi:hypothetical protein
MLPVRLATSSIQARNGCLAARQEMNVMNPPEPDLTVTAPNGVSWKRQAGGSSSAEEFLAALEVMTDSAGRIAREWNLWQEGLQAREHGQMIDVIRQWEHAAPPPGGYLSEQEVRQRLDASQARRDQERAAGRVRMLSAQATAGFMRNVLAKPASEAQASKASKLLAAAEQEAATLTGQIGDPDAVTDERGDLPPARRERHLNDHMTFFRHPTLREWSSGQRSKFRQLLAMPPPQPADMCSECQAPASWHCYALSLCLWRGRPEPGSRAETSARLMPGWWERCPACTRYQLHHQWGHNALPGFGPAQWEAILPPALRAIFLPAAPAPRKPTDQRAALARRLQAAEAEAGRLRAQLATIEAEDSSLQPGP